MARGSCWAPGVEGALFKLFGLGVCCVTVFLSLPMFTLFNEIDPFGFASKNKIGRNGYINKYDTNSGFPRRGMNKTSD